MIPGLNQWVQDPVLPQTGSGVAVVVAVAAAPSRPLAWELPYAAGATVKKKKSHHLTFHKGKGIDKEAEIFPDRTTSEGCGVLAQSTSPWSAEPPLGPECGCALGHGSGRGPGSPHQGPKLPRLHAPPDGPLLGST